MHGDVYCCVDLNWICIRFCMVITKGLVINYGEGGQGLQNGKIVGLKLFATLKTE